MIRPWSAKLISAAVSVAAGWAPAAAQEPAALRLMSFNIRYGTAADGPDAWPNRREQLFDLIRRENPDIIGLQEALRFQLDEIAAAIPGYFMAGAGRDDGVAAGEHAAILVSSAALEVEAGGTFWFSETPELPGSMHWGNRITRIATWVRLRERARGRSMTVFNVHLDHESQPSRERSVELLLRRVRLHAGRGPVVVMGDFNAGESNPAVTAMGAAGFADTWRLLHPSATVAGTFNAFRGDSTGEKIDYIFVRGPVSVEAAAILRDHAGGRYPSDHFPVTALVRPWPDAPAPGVGPELHGGGLAEIVVSATRLERRVADLPVRVEVVGAEEVEEKAVMTPGDVAMLLNETGGVRVQTTAPSLGSAGVRIHGMGGRHTRLLADGLPLFGPAGSLGLLQIPPLDLARVEVVKGAASASWGGGGLGGMINFVSRRPGEGSELLLNATTLGGADAVYFGSRPGVQGSGWTLLAGAHRQPRADRDGDGWTDIAGYRRVVVRPRYFASGEGGRSLVATAGATWEERDGGTLPGHTSPAGSPFRESLDTRRFDAGAALRAPAAGALLALRAAAMTQWHRQAFDTLVDDDRHATLLVDLSAARHGTLASLVAGIALDVEDFSSDSAPQYRFTFVAPGAFAEVELRPGASVVATVGARYDRHSEYGGRFSQRAAMLWRLAPSWSARLSAGTGWTAPTPFTDEVEEVGLRRVESLGPLRAERGWTASFDVGGILGKLELNTTLFLNRVNSPLRATASSAEALTVSSLEGYERTHGADFVARLRAEPLVVTGSWTLLRTSERSRFGGRAELPLNPRFSAGVVGMYEGEKTRVGVELYHTGRQSLVHNSFRDSGRPYFVAGLLVQRDVGPGRLFVNFENIFDARVTRYHSLVNPAYHAETGWTSGAWAPLEGRVVNAGMKIRWGG
jgi:outer membrane receptor for ferrienterochelin and colicins